MTAVKKFICPSCGLTDEPSPALEVCASCQSAAVQQVHAALAAEELPGESRALTDIGLLAESGVGCQPDQFARLLGVEGVEELARQRGRLVWLLADQVTNLNKLVDEVREELDAAGYLQLAADAREALKIALDDATEAERAREVIAANQGLFGEHNIVEALHAAAEVMAEHEQVLEQLYEHQVMTGGDPVVAVVQDVVAGAVEAERARELLFNDGRMQDDEDVPTAVQVLIAETSDVRELLIDSGHMSWEASRGSSWDPTPAEAVREIIETVEELTRRYEQERQRNLQLAVVARRVLTSSHAAEHIGEAEACPTCAADWALIDDVDGED